MLNPVATIRVVVVGAGSIGREFALHHFGPHTSTCVSAIVDTDVTAASLLARDVGALQAGAEVTSTSRYRSTVTSNSPETTRIRIPHDALLTDAILADCDMVYIGTTPSSHRELVVRALTARRHVLLEKPLASTPSDADAIVTAAETARRMGVHLGLNIGMRWNPATQLLRKLLSDTTCNTTDTSDDHVVRASLTLRFRRWPRDWQRGAAWCANRVDGGPLRECGTHYLAAVREVFGGGPGAVARVRATVVYPDGAAGELAESRVDGELELRSGLIVRVTVSVDDNDGTAAAADETAAEAGGDRYELELETQSGTVWQLYDFVKLRQRKKNTQALESDNGNVHEWKELIDAGKEGGYGRTESVTTLCDRVRGVDTKSNIVTAQDGREVQRMLDGLLLSNGEWVSV